jgi:hypothetical protein
MLNQLLGHFEGSRADGQPEASTIGLAPLNLNTAKNAPTGSSQRSITPFKSQITKE